jgi:hypothetical protein
MFAPMALGQRLAHRDAGAEIAAARRAADLVTTVSGKKVEMKLIDQWGEFKVVEQERFRSKRKHGLRSGSTEFQVRKGSRVISRHDTVWQAEKEARRLNDETWKEVGKLLDAASR